MNDMPTDNPEPPDPKPPVQVPLEDAALFVRKRPGYPEQFRELVVDIAEFFPWILILRKRLRFSLLEFWLFSTLWAVSSGLVGAGLFKAKVGWPVIAALLYVVFHIFSACFATALNNLRLWDKFPQKYRPSRWPMLIWHLFWPTLFSCIVGICLHVAYK